MSYIYSFVLNLIKGGNNDVKKTKIKRRISVEIVDLKTKYIIFAKNFDLFYNLI